MLVGPHDRRMNPTVHSALAQLAEATNELFQAQHLVYADPREPNVVAELFYLLRPRFLHHVVSNEYDPRESEVSPSPFRRATQPQESRRERLPAQGARL